VSSHGSPWKRSIHVEALRNRPKSLDDRVSRLSETSIQGPLGDQWVQVWDEVSCLDSIGDVMRLALDVLEGKQGESRLD
jgi:hypothetical protein